MIPAGRPRGCRAGGNRRGGECDRARGEDECFYDLFHRRSPAIGGKGIGGMGAAVGDGDGLGEAAGEFPKGFGLASPEWSAGATEPAVAAEMASGDIVTTSILTIFFIAVFRAEGSRHHGESLRARGWVYRMGKAMPMGKGMANRHAFPCHGSPFALVV